MGFDNKRLCNGEITGNLIHATMQATEQYNTWYHLNRVQDNLVKRTKILMGKGNENMGECNEQKVKDRKSASPGRCHKMSGVLPRFLANT